MLRTARLLMVTCLTTCLIAVPWDDALAQAAPEGVTRVAGEATLALGGLSTVSDADAGDRSIRRAARALVPSQSPRFMRAAQTVASTNKPNLILGVVSAALVVGGVALLAYGTTDSCKRTNTCDRSKVVGAVGAAGGSVILVVWALSR